MSLLNTEAVSNSFVNYTNTCSFTKAHQTDLSKISYTLQFHNLISKSNKNYLRYTVPYDKKVHEKTLSQIYIKPLKSSLPRLFPDTLTLLTTFLVEKSFIFSKNVPRKQVINVLSRVPTYKMNLISSVSADRFRGNIYHRLSIVNFDRFLKQATPAFLTKVNPFLFIELLKKNARSTSYSFLKNNKMTKSPLKLNFKLNYVKHKTLRLFLNNVLRRKFYKNFYLINVKKIIKNKKKRKRHAIKRTARLSAVNPTYKFHQIFLKKLFLGKKLNPMRTSLKQRQQQRYRYVLRLRLFRKAFLRRKHIRKKKNRFFKNMSYFSHNKLYHECKSVKEFNKINFRRKRSLFKTLSTTNDTITKLQTPTFLTQKPKT